MASKFSRWVRRMGDTRDDEIDCSECLDQISAYVQIEIDAGAPEQLMPKVRHHLDQCGICREEYLVLRSLARAESEGSLPTSAELIEKLKRGTK